jgi:hypothetical protein
MDEGLVAVKQWCDFFIKIIRVVLNIIYLCNPVIFDDLMI